MEGGRTIQAMDGHERPWTAMKGHERARKGTEGNGRPRSSVEIAYLVAREESSDEPRSAPRTPDGVSRRRGASSMLPHCRWEKVGEGVRRCEKVKEGVRGLETVWEGQSRGGSGEAWGGRCGEIAHLPVGVAGERGGAELGKVDGGGGHSRREARADGEDCSSSRHEG